MSQDEIDKGIKEILDYEDRIDERNRPKVLEILGEQALNLLSEAGISHLRVNKDGLLCGSRRSASWYPATVFLKGIVIKIEGDKIVIDAEVTKRIEHTGSVI